MSTLRAVVFDVGGVLEHTPRTGWEERWAARLGLDVGELGRRLDPIWNAGEVGTVALAEVERRVARALGLDAPALHAFMDDQWEEYLGTLNEELAAYFAALRPRFRTGILSNSFVGAREREQAAYGFQDMCDAIVYSHEEGMKKPEPRFYAIVCRRLGVAPSEVLFLDDTAAWVEAARRVGMAAVQYIDNAQAIDELESHLS